MLDTHVLLWSAEGRLTDDLSAILENPENLAVVSAASVWEIEIKRATGRLDAPADVAEMVDASGFDRLSITFEHTMTAARLPAHHADPFDRMLVAQAQLEGLVLATADPLIARYEVDTLSVGID